MLLPPLRELFDEKYIKKFPKFYQNAQVLNKFSKKSCFNLKFMLQFYLPNDSDLIFYGERYLFLFFYKKIIDS